jgi:hypothetical protein
MLRDRIQELETGKLPDSAGKTGKKALKSKNPAAGKRTS